MYMSIAGEGRWSLDGGRTVICQYELRLVPLVPPGFYFLPSEYMCNISDVVIGIHPYFF